MALWAEILVKRDLGIPVPKRKRQSFDRLFKTPEHVEYIAREAKTASRLRRLVDTNAVQLTNQYFMEHLEHQTVRTYREDLQERMDERARQAAKLMHLQLWESVLMGRSSLPPEQLDDPCMRQVREHQLKIKKLQVLANKWGISVQRIATMPHMWAEPSRFKRGQQREHSEKSSDPRPTVFSRTPPHKSASVQGDGKPTRTDSWRSRQLAIKMSEDSREKRIRRDRPSQAYRHLSGVSSATEEELCGKLKAERSKKVVVSPTEEIAPPPRDRRTSRVTPPQRPPVVFPVHGPPLSLLSYHAEVGRQVMRPLRGTDFIIPTYYRPKAPELLKAAKTLDEMYKHGNTMFEMPYPPGDNRLWDSVFSSRAEKKLKQQQAPVQTFRLVR